MGIADMFNAWKIKRKNDKLNKEVEKAKELITPEISLNNGEVCYYCKKVKLDGKESIGIRYGRESVCLEGMLYITNIRMVLMAPIGGFDLYVSQISQLIYERQGFRILAESNCYSVMTGDSKNIRKLIQLMNNQGVFKDNKWFEEHYGQLHCTTYATVEEEKGRSFLPSDFDNLSGAEFEEWCANLLRNHGFTNVQVTKASGDQGVDILAKKGDIKYAIQCKCYSSNLGNSPIQEVHAGKSMYNCHVGVVMTNCHFTSGAKELADATGVLLWDRETLLQMISDSENVVDKFYSRPIWNKDNPIIARTRFADDELDPKFREAVWLAIESQKISTSLIQRMLGVGYGRAAKIIDQMEDRGYVSAPDGNKPRKVLITMKEYMETITNANVGDK